MSDHVWCWDEHGWLDTTALGDSQPSMICVNCAVRIVRPETWETTPDGYVRCARLPGELRGVHGLSFAA